MSSALLRLAAMIVLALSLCVLSGAVTSVLAVAQTFGHAGDCCPSERTDDQSDEDCCVSPECQCLSCLTIDLQQVALELAGANAKDCTHQDLTATLIGETYRTIDYPPEVA